MAPNYFNLFHGALNDACNASVVQAMSFLKLTANFPMDNTANVQARGFLNSAIRRIVTGAKDSEFQACRVGVTLTDGNHGYSTPKVVHPVSALHAAAVTAQIREQLGDWYAVRY